MLPPLLVILVPSLLLLAGGAGLPAVQGADHPADSGAWIWSTRRSVMSYDELSPLLSRLPQAERHHPGSRWRRLLKQRQGLSLPPSPRTCRKGFRAAGPEGPRILSHNSGALRLLGCARAGGARPACWLLDRERCRSSHVQWMRALLGHTQPADAPSGTGGSAAFSCWPTRCWPGRPGGRRGAGAAGRDRAGAGGRAAAESSPPTSPTS